MEGPKQGLQRERRRRRLERRKPWRDKELILGVIDEEKTVELSTN